LSNNFFYGNVNPVLSVDNVIDSHVANNWGLFGSDHAVSTTPNTYMDFSMNRDNPSEDVIQRYLSKLPGHISARERDRASGDIKEYGSKIITSHGGYLALDNTRLRSSQSIGPPVTVHTNAGSRATGAVSSATDVKGLLTLTTGTGGWKAGEQVRVNFHTPYASIPIVLLVPQNAGASRAQKDRQVSLTTTNGYFSVDFDVADTSVNTYRWNYLVVE
jgi:hypothetical protein